MAEDNNFFSTIASSSHRPPRKHSESDHDDGDQAPSLAVLAKGPTFVRSQAKTLFQEELDIE